MGLGKHGLDVTIPVVSLNEQTIKAHEKCLKKAETEEEKQCQQRLIQKILYQEGFIATPQGLYILAKCHQTVVNNRVFLVLEGPTGVGKTHIPSIYARLTKKELKEGKIKK